jgi:hypothetical protein
MYTLDYDITQLERLNDRISAGAPIRIVHLLTDQSNGFATVWEDRYIVLIDCDPKTYLLLCMI